MDPDTTLDWMLRLGVELDAALESARRVDRDAVYTLVGLLAGCGVAIPYLESESSDLPPAQTQAHAKAKPKRPSRVKVYVVSVDGTRPGERRPRRKRISSRPTTPRTTARPT